VWLRVELRGGVVVGGVAHAIRHRRPVEVRVSAELARRLLAAGVPALTSAA
jgi:hypothetical protein